MDPQLQRDRKVIRRFVQGLGDIRRNRAVAILVDAFVKMIPVIAYGANPGELFTPERSSSVDCSLSQEKKTFTLVLSEELSLSDFFLLLPPSSLSPPQPAQSATQRQITRMRPKILRILFFIAVKSPFLDDLVT